jgi:hypothetical protein
MEIDRYMNANVYQWIDDLSNKCKERRLTQTDRQRET